MTIEREMLAEMFKYMYRVAWIKAQPDLERQKEALKLRAKAGYLHDRAQQMTVDTNTLGYDAARRRWTQLVDAKVAAGMTRFNAIQAVMREQPALYEALGTTVSNKDLPPVEMPPIEQIGTEGRTATPLDWDELIARIMRENGISRSAAIIKALRDHQDMIER